MIQTSGIFTGGGEGGKYKPYLTFKSVFPFAITGTTINCDGVLEYSEDTENWTTWQGSGLISSYQNSGEDAGNYTAYIRGSGNSIVNAGTYTRGIRLQGASVVCEGNIETLLDYATVTAGEHPIMGSNCFKNLFKSNPSLCVAPDLPATALSDSCYSGMFQGCTSLAIISRLPAAEVPAHGYENMFYGCSSLLLIPKINAAAVLDYGLAGMFNGCTKIKLSVAEVEGEYEQIYAIPQDLLANAASNMFADTGGTFTGTPTAGSEYYVSSANIVV